MKKIDMNEFQQLILSDKRHSNFIIFGLLLFLLLCIWTVSADENYTFVAAWEIPGSTTGHVMEPMGIAADLSDVYVTDQFSNSVLQFSSNGTLLNQWGTWGFGEEQFAFDRPSGIALDSKGNVYVADTLNNRIQKYSSDGILLGEWGADRPEGIALDKTGNVYIIGGEQVQEFNSTGAILSQWGSFGSGNGQFESAYGIAVNSGDDVYIADTGNNRIEKFRSDGTFLGQWGSFGSGNGQFSEPFDVALDSVGNVYVADTYNYRIQKFSSNGKYLGQWGSEGSGDGQFEDPYRIAVDSTGIVYVSDTYNFRIQEFQPKGSGIITNLQNTTYEQNYITWTWKDPVNSNFAYVRVYLDGVFKANVTKGIQYYKATGLLPKTKHTISTHTVDIFGNINQIWVNKTAQTKPGVPSVTNLQNSSYERNYITWTWTDPNDSGFVSVMVYLDGVFQENVTKGTQYYNATGMLPKTKHTLSTHTVDLNGNINNTWVNNTSQTKPGVPGITDLKPNIGRYHITWTWMDPSDPDFAYVMVYLDNVFKANFTNSNEIYVAVGLAPNTTHTISTHTVDINGNINKTWVKSKARTAHGIPSITNLYNTTFAPSYITWKWADPSDPDFAYVMVYLNGVFKTNVTKGTQYYNATDLLPKTKYTISTHAVDVNNYINKTWVNQTTKTKS